MSEPVATQWPRKIREESTIEADSRIWNEFAFRSGDIIIASYNKAGTTLTQQIVAQLLFNGAENVPVARLSPWLDFRLLPKTQVLAELQAQTHRRFIKTHLPADALPISPSARYIYIARDGRDVAWSFHRHLSNVFEEFNTAQWRHYDPHAERLPAYPPIPKCPRDFFLDWLRNDGYPHGSFFNNVRTWWAIQSTPNVLLTHFNAVRSDLKGEILRIARFLGIPIEGLRTDEIVAHCQLSYMKERARLFAPLEGKIFKGGEQTFFHQGTGGGWVGALAAEEVAEYEQMALSRLGAECALWLATG